MTEDEIVEDEKEFLEAFDNTEESEYSADSPPPTEPLDKEETSSGEEPEELDAWEGASDNAKSEHQAALDSAKDWEHKYKSDQGRFLAAQRAIKDPATVAKTHITEKAAESIKDPEKWDSFKEEYGDIAEALDDKLEFERARIREDVLQEVNAPLQELRQKEDHREITSQYAALDAAHDDWTAVVASNEYKDWMQNQPQTIQKMMRSQDAADAVYLLDSFKSRSPAVVETEQATVAEDKRTQRKQRLRSSQGLPGQGQKQTTLPKDDFDAVFASITT